MAGDSMRFDPLDVIKNDFYFGIGGIGDMILLMSTFYDDISPNTDVIFVCNNMNSIREVSKLFPKVNRFWFFPRKAFFPNEPMWESIVSNPLCIGTGVTPKRFDYVGDWIECGKTNVFDYYGVKEHPEFLTKLVGTIPSITIQPYGGSDANRKSEMPREFIESIVEKYSGTHRITLIGSKDDYKRLGVILGSHWVFDFDESVQRIKQVEFHIGVNSWCKTLAGLANVKTYIYPSTYNIEPIKAYGHDHDPSDYVFLKEAGWKFLDAMELIDED